MVGMQQIWVCYKKLNRVYTIWNIKMKLTHKLFHKMINIAWFMQERQTILDVPVLLLTVSNSIRTRFLWSDQTINFNLRNTREKFVYISALTFHVHQYVNYCGVLIDFYKKKLNTLVSSWAIIDNNIIAPYYVFYSFLGKMAIKLG